MSRNAKNREVAAQERVTLSNRTMTALVRKRFDVNRGPEIRATRIAASRQTFATRKRWLKWNQPLPHVGKKQQAKIEAGKHLVAQRCEGGAV